MTSLKQIEANRNNARRSTGPKTPAGKAISRLNASTHGLAGESEALTGELAEAFATRRASWGAEYRPEGRAAGWALDRLVAASLRIERCEEAVNAVIVDQMVQARSAWEPLRDAEAAEIGARLAEDPQRVAARLATTPQGVAYLIAQWRRLAVAVDTEGGWTESELSRALDLIGIPADLRRGWTPFDPPEGADPLEHRRVMISDEIDRLEALKAEALDPIDDLHRRQAEAGSSALLSKPASLALRYERDAWRRYRDAQRDLKAPPTPAEDLFPDEDDIEDFHDFDEPGPAPILPPRPAPLTDHRDRSPAVAPVRRAERSTDAIGMDLADFQVGSPATERTHLVGLTGGSPATERTHFDARGPE